MITGGARKEQSLRDGSKREVGAEAGKSSPHRRGTGKGVRSSVDPQKVPLPLVRSHVHFQARWGEKMKGSWSVKSGSSGLPEGLSEAP